MTNADVLKMVKGGVREQIVLAAVQTTPAVFDVSPEAIVALRKAGVTQKVIDAMLTAASHPAAAPGQTPTATSAARSNIKRMPTLAVMEESGPRTLPRERAQLLQTKVKPTSLTKMASDSVLAQAVQGGISTATQEATNNIRSSAASSTVGQASTIFSGVLSRRKPGTTYIWAIANPASANVVDEEQPSFTLDFSRVLDIKLQDFQPAIVRLTPAPTGQSNCRLVGATQGKEDALGSFAADWEVYSGFTEDRVAIHLEMVAPGKYKISIASPLSAGEYGVVLRPASKSKKFSGGQIERNQGDGLLFNTVWSFQVPAEAD